MTHRPWYENEPDEPFGRSRCGKCGKHRILREYRIDGKKKVLCEACADLYQNSQDLFGAATSRSVKPVAGQQ